MATVWASLARYLLPTRCVLCQQLGPDVICSPCLGGLQRVAPNHCLRCGRKRQTGFASPDCGECHGRGIGVQRARSAFIYNEPARAVLGEFKFRRHLGAGQVLVAEALERTPASSAELYAEPDLRLACVAPVPLHPSRQRARRFNQSEFIAQRVARHLGAACDPRLLERKRDTPTQVGLSAHQRAENVRGAFTVNPRLAGTVKDRSVLVVDDLMTTGATLHACASALRRAGCRSVYGFTLFSTHHDVETADGLLPV